MCGSKLLDSYATTGVNADYRRNALESEKKLMTSLAEKEPTYIEVTHSLAESVSGTPRHARIA